MQQTIGNKKYELLVKYQKDDQYRQAFNSLALRVFDLSFEDWYQAGYWNDKYIPYTLFMDRVAIANVSVNIMDFIILGEKVRFAQLGTIMTDPDYRNQHLSTFLMDWVIKEWEDKAELLYLYANPSVIDFYPKFGFAPAKEYQHIKVLEKTPHIKPNFKKLEMTNDAHRQFLCRYISHSADFGKINLHDNSDLIMFYALSMFKDKIYYFPVGDFIAFVTVEGSRLKLWDVYSPKKIELEKIIAAFASEEVTEIIFGFTPKNGGSYRHEPLAGDDTLFIRGEKSGIFSEWRLMFPLLSHA